MAPRRLLAALAATVAAVALLAGCGGGGGDAPEQPPAGTANPVEWAEAYCTGATAARDAALAGLSVPRIEPAQQKQALEEFLTAAETAYRDSLRRLQELGAPAVERGRTFQQTALELYRAQLEAVEGQQEALAALDPAAPDFMQRLSGIVSESFDRRSLQQRTDAIATDPQLAPALEQAQACRQGRPGGAGG